MSSIGKIFISHASTDKPFVDRLAADLADGNQLFLDGKELAGETVPLVDDHREHSVELKLWSPASAPENRSVIPAAV